MSDFTVADHLAIDALDPATRALVERYVWHQLDDLMQENFNDGFDEGLAVGRREGADAERKKLAGAAEPAPAAAPTPPKRELPDLMLLATPPRITS